MPVISISIVRSPIEIVSGIPLTVTLSTNISATIYYTLDGTLPTPLSSIAVGPIALPTNTSGVILQAFATNGVDVSPVFYELFGPVSPANVSTRAKIDNMPPAGEIVDNFPFGGPNLVISPHFDGPAGIVMDSPGGGGFFDGYDADGNPAGETNAPLDTFELVYSETDKFGRMGAGIGTLPSHTTVRALPAEDMTPLSHADNPLFNPRALVIYQDDTKDPDGITPQMVNRPYFNMQDGKSERVRDGALLFSTAFEGNGVTGSFLRAYYSPKDGTYTYYYYDNQEGRWIISKTSYQPKAGSGALYSMVFRSGREEGAGFVYEWVPFKRRYLF